MRSLSYTFFHFPAALVGSNIGFGWVSEIAIHRATMDGHERDATLSFCYPAYHRLCAAAFRCAIHELVNTVGTAVQALDSVPGKDDKLKNETRVHIVELLLKANVGSGARQAEA
jgi:hypothetical protein